MMKRRDQIQLVVFAVSSLAYFPFSQWISTTRFGTTFFLWGQLLYILPLLAAILGTPVLIVCLFFQRTRKHSLFFLMLSILFVPCFIGGILLGRKVRSAGMQSFVQRSQLLVAAIHQYELDNSVPPASLDDLVPTYISGVPSTGMMAYPEYEYITGDSAKERYEGNPWVLTVFTPSGGINFDMMLYFPSQNYPSSGYGGGLERIDNWAYLHE